MDSLSVIFNALPYILGGTFVTMGAVGAALAMGLCLGVPFAVTQVYGPPLLRRLVALYVWFFRGIPILVLLFLFVIRRRKRNTSSEDDRPTRDEDEPEVTITTMTDDQANPDWGVVTEDNPVFTNDNTTFDDVLFEEEWI